MTHFTTYAIGNYDEEELNNKFNERTIVPEYITGNVSEEDIIAFLNYYTTRKRDHKFDSANIIQKIPKLTKLLIEYDNIKKAKKKRSEIFSTIADEFFEPFYEEFGENWNSRKWRKNNEGVWENYSTNNPNAVFDYFSEEEETTLGAFSSPIDTLSNSCGVFKDNQYYRFYDVGWFGYTNPIIKKKEAKNIIKNLIENLPPDTPIYRFDCHI